MPESFGAVVHCQVGKWPPDQRGISLGMFNQVPGMPFDRSPENRPVAESCQAYEPVIDD